MIQEISKRKIGRGFDMSIDETKIVLSYIYSTHINAPKLSKEDKQRVVMSFYRILYKYSMSDVMSSVDVTCASDKGFVPTPYEIEKNIKISIDVSKFLPAEYYKLDAECADLKYENLYRLYYEARAENEVLQTDESQKKMERIKRRIEINEKIAPMYTNAIHEAERHYFSQNEQKEIGHESGKDTKYIA